ncbi:MAG: hypothetical protein DME25_01215 [Verrucomicrobia bacterium]|nr:MAG: hypothetical protein DME25_01215 [Verrucomicrobiota bacterium]
MTFLPIVDRELRAAARRKGTYRLRSWTAVVGMLAGFGFLLAYWVSPGRGNMGDSLFTVLSGYTFGLCALAGVFLTADCLSEEKREGTLGLLFLTDLKGYDVALGKFLGRSLNALYGLLALLPVLGLALLLGGVTGREFWRMALALVNALLFSLALGLAVSAVARDSQRAMGCTFGCLLAFLAGLPALTGLRHAGLWVAWLSPLYPFANAREWMYLGRAADFWGPLVCSQLLSWLFLGFAGCALPRLWREPGKEGSLEWHFKPLGARNLLLARNPLLGLLSSQKNPAKAAWLIVIVWGLVVILAPMFVPRPAASVVVGWYVMRPFGFLLKVLFTFQLCRFLVEARSNGILEALLCTPLTSRDILKGHTLALRRSFLWPVVTFLGLLLAPVGAAFMQFVQTADFPSFMGFLGGSFSAIFGGVRLVADICALYWFGLWLALWLKRPAFAPGLAVLYVLVLPTPLSFCLVDIFADLFFILWGATQLQQDWRWLLARQYSQLGARSGVR